jgi:hypothetical protein
MNVYQNIAARSCDHCCSGKAVSITYCECVFVAWGIHHAKRMRHIVNLWRVWLYNIFPHYTVWVCVCSLMYPACNAHAPHCLLWLVPSTISFPTLSHKRHDFRIKCNWKHSVCFEIPYKFVWNIFHFKKNWARYNRKCASVFMCSTVIIVIF